LKNGSPKGRPAKRKAAQSRKNKLALKAMATTIQEKHQPDDLRAGRDCRKVSFDRSMPQPSADDARI